MVRGLRVENVVRQKCLSFLALVLASSIFSSCANAQDYSGYDLSTVERVNAAREAKSGKPLDTQSKNCVVISKQLPDTILLGSFASDRGCQLSGAIIKKQGFSTDKDISKVALENLGWKNADTQMKKKLALNWVQFGLLAFENPLTQPAEDFTGQPFQTPYALWSEDGSITVWLWVQRPSGMRCERGYDNFSYNFMRDGTLDKKTTEKSFSVPC
jgi:hypothetical protein